MLSSCNHIYNKKSRIIMTILNLNIGILGHVDSGKTSLAKAISTELSTASLDRDPQSKRRGITLDLGFSCVRLPVPNHMKGKFDEIQLTLVDCPGHASLIRTIIGGAQIIDMVILVIDATKGIQTQTAECLVIAEILTDHLLVVVNKMDKLEGNQNKKDKLLKGLRKTFGRTKFGSNVSICCVSANPGGGSIHNDNNNKIETDTNVVELMDKLKDIIHVPNRNPEGDFFFLADHCFRIGGKGTVLTGTVLSGCVEVNQTIAIPRLKMEKKVKSMQMFRKPVDKALQGDRVGICVSQLDPKLFERGLVASQNSALEAKEIIISVEKIRFYKSSAKTKERFHFSIGHTTVMGTVQFFSLPPRSSDDKKVEEKKDTAFDWNIDYLPQDELQINSMAYPSNSQYALVQLDKNVIFMPNCVVIGSHLDSDIHSKSCRLAFYGTILEIVDRDLHPNQILRFYRPRERYGNIDRVVDSKTIIAKDLFTKGTDVNQFLNLPVVLEINGQQGFLEGAFGSSGKVRIKFPNILNDKDGKEVKKGSKLKSKVILRFKKLTVDGKKTIQAL